VRYLGAHLTKPRGEHLAALFASTIVGVAFCDRQMRFKSVNQRLAIVNGFPVASHIGAKVHQIVGGAVAEEVGICFERVFSTGEPIVYREFTAKLLARNDLLHWVESFYPIKSGSNRVSAVCGAVLEVADNRAVEDSLGRISSRLSEIREDGTQSCEVVKTCLAEVRAVRNLLRCQITEPGIECGVVGAKRLTQRERQVFRLVAKGYSSKQVAEILQISTRTVEAHRATLMLKLGLRRAPEIVRCAFQNGEVEE
jgi:DNA-binding CsgD family transcriptional regulator